jgi:hypothetical protein
MLKIPLGIQANDATSENWKEKSLMLVMKPNFQEVQIWFGCKNVYGLGAMNIIKSSWPFPFTPWSHTSLHTSLHAPKKTLIN